MATITGYTQLGSISLVTLIRLEPGFTSPSLILLRYIAMSSKSSYLIRNIRIIRNMTLESLKRKKTYQGKVNCKESRSTDLTFAQVETYTHQ